MEEMVFFPFSPKDDLVDALSRLYDLQPVKAGKYESAMTPRVGGRMTVEPLSVPDGFLRFSDAISRLAEGMWGGLRRPKSIQAIKRIEKKRRLDSALGESAQDSA